MNTSVVHMPDQRFSKNTLIEICPFDYKHPRNKNFMWFCIQFYTPIQDFLGNMFHEIEVFEKLPLNAPSRIHFLKRYVLTPNSDSQKLHSVSKNNPFFVSLVAHGYNTSIWVALCSIHIAVVYYYYIPSVPGGHSTWGYVPCATKKTLLFFCSLSPKDPPFY